MTFEEYLLTQNVVTENDLVKVREHSLLVQQPLGKLAVEHGLFDRRDNIEILLERRKRPDKRFGEIAMEMGLLREEDLKKLLGLQKLISSHIGPMLVELGILDKMEMVKYWLAFKKEQGQDSV